MTGVLEWVNMYPKGGVTQGWVGGGVFIMYYDLAVILACFQAAEHSCVV